MADGVGCVNSRHNLIRTSFDNPNPPQESGSPPSAAGFQLDELYMLKSRYANLDIRPALDLDRQTNQACRLSHLSVQPILPVNAIRPEPFRQQAVPEPEENRGQIQGQKLDTWCRVTQRQMQQLPPRRGTTVRGDFREFGRLPAVPRDPESRLEWVAARPQQPAAIPAVSPPPSLPRRLCGRRGVGQPEVWRIIRYWL
jgi:hypothetical protein